MDDRVVCLAQLEKCIHLVSELRKDQHNTSRQKVLTRSRRSTGTQPPLLHTPRSNLGTMHEVGRLRSELEELRHEYVKALRVAQHFINLHRNQQSNQPQTDANKNATKQPDCDAFVPPLSRFQSFECMSADGLHQLTQDSATMDGKVRALETKIRQLQTTIARITTEKEAQLTQCHAEIEALKQQNTTEELQLQLEETSVELEEFQNRVVELESTIRQLRTQQLVQGRSGEVQRLQQALDSQNRQMQTLSHKISFLETTNAKLRGEKEIADEGKVRGKNDSSLVAALRAHIKSLLCEKEDWARERTVLLTAQQQARHEVTKLKLELENWKTKQLPLPTLMLSHNEPNPSTSHATTATKATPSTSPPRPTTSLNLPPLSLRGMSHDQPTLSHSPRSQQFHSPRSQQLQSPRLRVRAGRLSLVTKAESNHGQPQQPADAIETSPPHTIECLDVVRPRE